MLSGRTTATQFPKLHHVRHSRSAAFALPEGFEPEDNMLMLLHAQQQFDEYVEKFDPNFTLNEATEWENKDDGVTEPEKEPEAALSQFHNFPHETYSKSTAPCEYIQTVVPPHQFMHSHHMRIQLIERPAPTQWTNTIQRYFPTDFSRPPPVYSSLRAHNQSYGHRRGRNFSDSLPSAYRHHTNQDEWNTKWKRSYRSVPEQNVQRNRSYKQRNFSTSSENVAHNKFPREFIDEDIIFKSEGIIESSSLQSGEAFPTLSAAQEQLKTRKTICHTFVKQQHSRDVN